MKTYEATEQAYKNGYEKGKQDAVKHGRWNEINQTTTGLPWKYRCNKCGCPQDYAHNYCPNCGARMDGDGNG
jgi:rubrerythrin